jgi:hypothetical protein
MPKKKKAQRRFANPDFRPRNHVPAPPVADIERRLRSVLTPNTFAAARQQFSVLGLRQRVLTLPVMVAVVLTLVWRQLPSLSELLRVLEREGLFEAAPMQVTKQSLSERLQSLPATLFAQVFNEAVAQLQHQPLPEVTVPFELREVCERFPHCYVADGSTLEALRRKLKALKEESDPPLGGKMMCLLELFTRRVEQSWYSPDSKTDDKDFCQQLLDGVVKGGLIVFDLGFFKFTFFDAFTAQGKYFVTRLREKTAYRVVETLSRGPHYRDEIIELGLYRSNPCEHPVRLVSVLWGSTSYKYITNVLDDKQLSARQVCAVYRQRWGVEDAFLLTKRLLGLSYLWVGSRNGVEIQVYATWLFYAVLVSLCAEVAAALHEPLERISVEMVFRSLYHYSRAIEMGEEPELIPFLVKHAKLFGLVKAERKRHRERAAQNQVTWGSLS